VSALLGIPTAYIVRLLWLDDVATGFEGFFVHQHKFVHIENDGWTHVQRLAWTDYIRQLLFNVYEVGQDTWVLKPNRQGLVRCTFCLSFWISFLPAILLMIHYSLPIFAYPLVHFSVASVSAILSDRM
jgi:hypothetical protein